MAHSQSAEPTRRDFLYVATAAVGTIGAAATLIPLIEQMNPSADVLALASIEIDLAPIQPGQSVVFTWRSHPLFVRRRTPEEITAAKAVKVEDLLDPVARNGSLPDNAPATDENRTKPREGAARAGMVGDGWRLHASGLHTRSEHGAKPPRRLRRLALPLPWLAI